MSRPAPPKRPLTLAQSVAADIRERILRREIAGGEPLRQEAISKALGASIIPVREALRQLESEGLVELHPHRGAVVTEFTLAQALEWIHLRRIIETDLIGVAIDKLTDAHLARAQSVLSRFDAALEEGRDVARWSEYNWDFHSALYESASRPETMKVLAMLHKNCDRYIRLQLLEQDHIERAEQEHAELLELCGQRKKREAKTLLHKHIVGVERDLVEQLGG
ncbi:MAG: GntR family transcriptional regulator [Gammaproteobacteria bacterium]|nr:GntR family transcriptional regulator [Gammaproteobacteria bacterium]